MKYSRNVEFWLVVLTILVTIVISVAIWVGFVDLLFFVGPYLFGHWLGWIGTFFIAIVSPLYYMLKRKKPRMIKTLVKVHVFGSLVSFLLITIHFMVQVTRPPEAYPDLNTGIILQAVMLILVITGFLYRFKIIRSVRPHLNRFLHISITLSFYLVIGVHTLQGLLIL